MDGPLVRGTVIGRPFPQLQLCLRVCSAQNPGPGWPRPLLPGRDTAQESCLSARLAACPPCAGSIVDEAWEGPLTRRGLAVHSETSCRLFEGLFQSAAILDDWRSFELHVSCSFVFNL